jgi:Carbohydrate-selective porin, OprB family
VVYTRISPTLTQAYADAGLPLFGSEEAVEVNYTLKITRWFTLQPVGQYYFDTGANPLATTPWWRASALASAFKDEAP